MITLTYDLKGSTHNRETDINEKNKNDPFLARKDLNFLKDENNLKLEKRDMFLDNVTKDSEFFEDLNLMDYSLLVLKLKFDEMSLQDFKNSPDYLFYQRHVYFSSSDSNEAYMCVIIDFLQDFNFLKKMENISKNFITQRPSKSNLISCVPSDVYSKRFVEFFNSRTYFNTNDSINENEIKN